MSFDAVTYDAVQRLTGPEIGEGVAFPSTDVIIKAGNRTYLRSGYPVSKDEFPNVPVGMRSGGEVWDRYASTNLPMGMSSLWADQYPRSQRWMAQEAAVTGAGAHLWRSTDDGLTFARVGAATPGSGGNGANGVIMGYNDTWMSVVARTNPSVRSTDFFTTKGNVTLPGSGSAIVCFARATAGAWMIGFDVADTTNGVLRSADQGATWAQIKPSIAAGSQIRCMAHNGAGKWMAVGVVGTITRTSSIGSFTSIDDGVTWQVTGGVGQGIPVSLEWDGYQFVLGRTTVDASNAGVNVISAHEINAAGRLSAIRTIFSEAATANTTMHAAYPAKNGTYLYLGNGVLGRIVQDTGTGAVARSPNYGQFIVDPIGSSFNTSQLDRFRNRIRVSQSGRVIVASQSILAPMTSDQTVGLPVPYQRVGGMNVFTRVK